MSPTSGSFHHYNHFLSSKHGQTISVWPLIYHDLSFWCPCSWSIVIFAKENLKILQPPVPPFVFSSLVPSLKHPWSHYCLVNFFLHSCWNPFIIHHIWHFTPPIPTCFHMLLPLFHTFCCSEPLTPNPPVVYLLRSLTSWGPAKVYYQTIVIQFLKIRGGLKFEFGDDRYRFTGLTQKCRAML